MRVTTLIRPLRGGERFRGDAGNPVRRGPRESGRRHAPFGPARQPPSGCGGVTGRAAPHPWGAMVSFPSRPGASMRTWRTVTCRLQIGMFEIQQTDTFTAWFDRLRDIRAQARITARLRRLSTGHLGDVKPIGEGVSELRIDYGPGYRIYFTQRGRTIILLVCEAINRARRRTSNGRRSLQDDGENHPLGRSRLSHDTGEGRRIP
ncbi:type II toxin-antitoxin system RelE/ParE family toxin [Methylobacterium sp. EM32]|uniref:type II toxin-antitoxin system RelE/ParE family toxin n=1 Tax=Methylobacterium sp. EM32 TaxID=3163481 RepID=UPI0038B3DDC9